MDGAVLREDAGDRLLDHHLLADVADVATHLAAVGFDFGAHRFELFDLAADDGHGRAQAGEFVGGAAADAAAAAGDDVHFTLEQVGTEHGTVFHGNSSIEIGNRLGCFSASAS